MNGAVFSRLPDITMIEIEAKLKRWGRSFGIIVPMEKIKENALNENESLNITIERKENPFLKNFGRFKRPRQNTKKMLKKLREEAWDE